jgi:hypothetical protein
MTFEEIESYYQKILSNELDFNDILSVLKKNLGFISASMQLSAGLVDNTPVLSSDILKLNAIESLIFKFVCDVENEDYTDVVTYEILPFGRYISIECFYNSYDSVSPYNFDMYEVKPKHTVQYVKLSEF